MSVEGWIRTTFGDVAKLEYGSALPSQVRANVGLPVYGSSGVVGRHTRALVEGPGIVVGRKGTVGSVIWSWDSFWPIDTTYYAVPVRAVDWRWLYWTLLSLPLGRLDSSTGVPGLNRNDAYELIVDLPRLPEQRRIAAILDTVDEAIRKTEQVIAKLQQMKQGLLHDLLTRGIDENGELRDPERHPEQFKDSPLGRIPRGWVVQSLSQCLLRTPQNGLYKSANDIGRGALMVGQTAFTATRSIDYGLSRRAVASQAEVASWGLEGGDILVSRVFATVDGVGQPVLVPDPPEPAIYESNMMRLKVDQSLIAPALVFHWLRHPPVRRQVVANTNSSNQSSINQRGLGGVQLGVPDPAEQSALLQSADAWDARLHRETTELAKLRLLKQGLMDDLLTGRVRVKVPTEER